ncbi:hypothetical protein HPP92_019484 [Vanilla planifolia]|uniref:NPH3 domain-containing protein n=1 Tax=Vanilla planifolia TaxID=51239 RepID=A0A835Q2Y4_VANPL|nr:hypothetical protein HPP92_019484 [Vanilla planifolia]
MQAHPWLTDSEREQLCRLMNCQKLSLEACTHAAQNERLPLRVVVQVLFFEQLRLRTSVAGWLFVSDDMGNTNAANGGLILANNTREITEEIIQEEPADGGTPMGMLDMKQRVAELENECLSMKQEIEKLGKPKLSWSVICKNCPSLALVQDLSIIQARGSPQLEGDDEEDDVDDLESEFDHAKTDCKTTQMWSPQGREEAVDLSSSSRHEPYHCIMRLTSRQQVSGEIPEATSDNHSLRSQSGPLGSSEKRSSTYVDPSLPVPVRIVDPSKDLNSYGLESIDWKERVEGWKLKQDKSIIHASSKYADGKGDMEGTGSNGEELQIYDREGEPSQLVPIDVFVSTVDPLKEPPLITANTVLSILAVDYPVDKVSCYVSDDGSAMLTFEALSETAEFAKNGFPFARNTISNHGLQNSISPRR